MMQNYYLQEKLAEAHRQNLLREAEQRRMVVHLRQHSFSLTRRSAVKLGGFLVMLGMSLKQLGPRSEHLLQKQ